MEDHFLQKGLPWMAAIVFLVSCPLWGYIHVKSLEYEMMNKVAASLECVNDRG